MVLFFMGLLDLLWSLHTVVASVVTVIIAVSLSFLVFTTIMPTLRPDCPYKSPQALGIFLFAQIFARLMSLIATQIYSCLGWARPNGPLGINPELFDHRKRQIALWLRSFVHRKHSTSWREREKASTRQREATLDRQILVDADATLMDDEFLNKIIRPCIVDIDRSAALDCLHNIVMHRADGVRQDGIPFWARSEDVNGGVNLLLHLVTDILPSIDAGDQHAITKTLMVAESLCRAIPFEYHGATVILYQRLFEVLARFLAHSESVRQMTFNLMRVVWDRSSASVSPSGERCPFNIYPSKLMHGSVIKSLVAFARSTKHTNNNDNNSNETFHGACEIILTLSIAPTFSPIDFDEIRDDLQSILADLEPYLMSPERGGSAKCSAIILALRDLFMLAPDLISTNVARMLVRVGQDAEESDSIASGVRRRVASARTLINLREVMPWARNPRPRRRNALDVPAGMGGLSIQVPHTPERQWTVVVSPDRDCQMDTSSPAPIPEHAVPSLTSLSRVEECSEEV